MGEMHVRFKDPNQVIVSHLATKAEWTFYVEKDRSGCRHLDGPHGTMEAMSDGNLMQQACTTAQSEALRAAKIDY